MHERTLIRSLFRQVEEIVRGEEERHVSRVAIRVGELSGIDTHLFRLAFDEMKLDTVLANASLELVETKLEARCTTCRHEFTIQGYHFSCPVCGDGEVRVLQGDELLLESVTLGGGET